MRRRSSISWIPALGSHAFLLMLVCFALFIHGTGMDVAGLPGDDPRLKAAEWGLLGSFIGATVLCWIGWIFLIARASMCPFGRVVALQILVYGLGWVLCLAFVQWDPWQTISWWLD
jgi:hypothetical protein